MKKSLNKYLLFVLCLFNMSSFVSIAVANVFLGISISIFLIILYIERSFCINEYNLPYFKAVGVLASTLLISALCSGDIVQGLKTWADFFLWRFMPFLILLFVFDKKEDAKKVYYAILGAFLVDALYVIYQGVFVYKLNINLARPYGFTGHPMTFAGFLCILVPILLVLVFESKVLDKYSKLALPAFIVGSGALVLNSTRGAWLAVGIVVSLICLNYMFRSKRIFIGCVALMLVGGLVLSNNQAFMKRINTFNDVKVVSQNPRFKIWDASFKMFKNYPVLGVGLGQYKYAYQNVYMYIEPQLEKQKEIIRQLNSFRKLDSDEQKIAFEQPKSLWYLKSFKKLKWKDKKELLKLYDEFLSNYNLSRLTHAHNNFLQMLAENGLAGFAGYVLAFGYILWRNIKNYFVNKNPYALMIAGSTGALVLQGLTEYNFGNGAVMKLYWLVLGCLVVLAGWYNKENTEEESE